MSAGLWPSSLRDVKLNARNAAALELALNEDSLSYLFSAWVTFADSLRGFQQGFYSWASVKAYYATFYALRSILATSGYGIVYAEDKPRGVQSVASSNVDKLRGNTHDVVLSVFKKRLPSHTLLSQSIATMAPLAWLSEIRVQANYRSARFPEPEVPPHMDQIATRGVRKSLAAYDRDDTYLYVFDPDHAIFAFPLAALRYAQEEFLTTGVQGLSRSAVQFLMSTLRDPAGALPSLCARVATLEQR